MTQDSTELTDEKIDEIEQAATKVIVESERDDGSVEHSAAIDALDVICNPDVVLALVRELKLWRLEARLPKP